MTNLAMELLVSIVMISIKQKLKLEQDKEDDGMLSECVEIIGRAAVDILVMINKEEKK